MSNIEKLLGIASDTSSTGIFTDTLSFVTDKYGRKSSFELSDEELSMVAGGVDYELKQNLSEFIRKMGSNQE